MVYTKTSWSETGMTTNQKVSALNNLETQYDEMASYLAGLTHTGRYYTKAECDAKYFTKASKTAGSVCETLDGYTYEEIFNMGVPSGNIGIWSGSIASLPAGWILCDGNNSTPDLRDMFIVGAGESYGIGSTGGSTTCTADATLTVSDHTLTTAELPKHIHTGIVDNYPDNSLNQFYSNYQYDTWGNTTPTVNTDPAGSGNPHGHPGSTFTPTPNQDKRPTYHALAFIMKA
jgi:microcystin-dependent protein